MPPLPELDVSYLQIDPKSEWYSFAFVQPIAFLVRAPLQRADSLTSSARNAMREIDPTQPVFEIQTMEDVRANSLIGPRFAWLLVMSFAVLSTLIALAGVYGVMSYFVAQRTREIGVRMALGASRGDIFGFVFRTAGHFTFAGSLLGLIGSLAMGKLIQSMLFGVAPYSLVTLAISSVLILAMAAAAAFLPAWRATKADPVVVLKYE